MPTIFEKPQGENKSFCSQTKRSSNIKLENLQKYNEDKENYSNKSNFKQKSFEQPSSPTSTSNLSSK